MSVASARSLCGGERARIGDNEESQPEGRA